MNELKLAFLGNTEKNCHENEKAKNAKMKSMVASLCFMSVFKGPKYTSSRIKLPLHSIKNLQSLVKTVDNSQFLLNPTQKFQLISRKSNTRPLTKMEAISHLPLLLGFKIATVYGERIFCTFFGAVDDFVAFLHVLRSVLCFTVSGIALHLF